MADIKKEAEDECHTSTHFLDIFDRIFSEKLKEYLEKERKNYNLSTDERDAQLFNFAQTRIKEIENWVRICFKAEK